MSQGSFQVPTGGTESAVTFAGQCNTAWLAVASKNSGGSAPANGPGSAALANQDWFDTSNANFPDWKLFDGSQWPRKGTLDTVNHNWFPVAGGGLATVASAGTTDIGSHRETYQVISGSVTITSFGGSAQIGETKKLKFSGSPLITNSASIVCPGGANIQALPGDTAELVYIGSSAWQVFTYSESSSVVGGGVPTGAVMWDPYRTTAPVGWVRANGGTIGNTGSAATELADPSTFGLYSYLWNLASGDSEIVVSGGGRGGSPAADFAALKTITTVDGRGRLFGGVDQMGAAAPASRITSTTASPNGTTQGAVGGAQVVTLATPNLPAYTPTGTVGISDPQHSHTVSIQFVGNAGGSGSTFEVTGGSTATSSNATGITASFTGTAQGGTATAVNKMPPFKLGTFLQKL